MSVAKARIARCALPVAATAGLASALGPMLGGSRAIGLFVLAAGLATAGLTVLAARRPRVLRDDAVAELDRAAGLCGLLRSAHWFALQRVGQAGDRHTSWVARHLEEAADRGAQVDWSRVYERPTARLSWTLALACGLATLGLFARPLPRLLRPSPRTVEAARDPARTDPGTTGAPDSLAPQVLEGIRVMSSGRTPSEEQLSAIGRVLEIAKYDAAARRQIEAEVSGAEVKRDRQYASSDSDSANSAWSDDFNDGFEIADLDWAYQEAMARAHMDPRARPEPGSEAQAAEAAGNATSDARPGEPSAAGAMTGAPVAADTRGQPVNFTSLLLGRQQANGRAVSTEQAPEPGRAARLSAALRNEVVHARSDFTGPDLDAPAARRATRADPAPVAAVVAAHHVRYDRSRATQPPAIPGARRLLVHDFFLRPADAVPTAKRP